MKEKNKSSKLTFLELFKAFLPVAAVKNGRDGQLIEGEKGCRYGRELSCLFNKQHFELSFS